MGADDPGPGGGQVEKLDAETRTWNATAESNKNHVVLVVVAIMIIVVVVIVLVSNNKRTVWL